VDAQGDCEKEYEEDYSWLHCRNGTALREVAPTLKRALGNTSDPLYGAYRTEDGSEVLEAKTRGPNGLRHVFGLGSPLSRIETKGGRGLGGGHLKFGVHLVSVSVCTGVNGY